MIKLTEQQLFDYIYCPVKYYFKYKTKIKIEEDFSLQKQLNKVAQYFYFNLLNGKVPSMNDLKRQWDKICEQNKLHIDNKKVISGWAMIIKLVEWAEEQQIIVGDVSPTFMIPTSTYQLSGNIDTILVRKDKKIELLTTSFSDRLPNEIDTSMKLKYSLDYLGFYQIYGQYPDGYRIHSVKYNQDIFTNRTNPDIIRIKDTIKNVAKSIEENIFYPRESSFCSNCKAKQYCKYWTDQTKK